MKKQFTLFSFFLFLASFVYAQETITMTSYYPSPFGSYDRLRLVPRPPSPPCGSVNDVGMMYFDQITNTLQICADTGGGVYAWTVNNVWTQTGNNIYPTQFAMNPNVGIGTDTPAVPLHLVGSLDKANIELLRLENKGLTHSRASINFYDNNGLGASIEGGGSGTGGQLRYLVGGAERMRIEGNGNVGIATTSSPTSLFQVEDTVHFLPKSVAVAPQIAEYKLMWLPGKGGAFRAGADPSDDANVGMGSVAMGLYTIASGHLSYAFGEFASAVGDYSYAFGNMVAAQAAHSYVFGYSGQPPLFGAPFVNTIGSSIAFVTGNKVPTLFLARSGSGPFDYVSGSVGIGTMTPSYKLEVGEGSPLAGFGEGIGIHGRYFKDSMAGIKMLDTGLNILTEDKVTTDSKDIIIAPKNIPGLVVKDGGDVYLPVVGSALIMKSPGGLCYRFAISDAGKWEDGTLVDPCP